MPANKKHLSSNWQRFAKITAGVLGGYFVSISLHLALAIWLDRVVVIITGAFSGFIVWVALMVIAFLSKNGWKIWLWYILATVILLCIMYFGKLYFPIHVL